MEQFKEIPATKRSVSLRKPVCAVGTNDADYIISLAIDGKQVMCPFYLRWVNMLQRCYSSKVHERRPTYIGCSVTGEWLIFSNFKRWMIAQDWEGKELDKDMVITGNKIYSPDTCVFISSQINSLLNDCGASRGELPKGVSRNNKEGRFRARCSTDAGYEHIGYFDTPEDASYAYKHFKSNLILSIASEQEEPLKSQLIRISCETRS